MGPFRKRRNFSSINDSLEDFPPPALSRNLSAFCGKAHELKTYDVQIISQDHLCALVFSFPLRTYPCAANIITNPIRSISVPWPQYAYQLAFFTRHVRRTREIVVVCVASTQKPSTSEFDALQCLKHRPLCSGPRCLSQIPLAGRHSCEVIGWNSSGLF